MYESGNAGSMVLLRSSIVAAIWFAYSIVSSSIFSYSARLCTVTRSRIRVIRPYTAVFTTICPRTGLHLGLLQPEVKSSPWKGIMVLLDHFTL